MTWFVRFCWICTIICMKQEITRSLGVIALSAFKKGDVNDAQNYRGTTLINILAKIYSQLLLNRLTNWARKYEKKIIDNQFGFQKGKSTTDCVFLLHSIISKVLNSGKKLYCVFIDYEKIFDKIDRSHLWQKLLTENVSCKLIKAIRSMYATVKLCVKYNNTFSHFFNSHIGLKQLHTFIYALSEWHVTTYKFESKWHFYTCWNEILSHSFLRWSGGFCQFSPIIAITSHRYRKLLRGMGPTYKYIKNKGEEFLERKAYILRAFLKQYQNWFSWQLQISWHNTIEER